MIDVLIFGDVVKLYIFVALLMFDDIFRWELGVCNHRGFGAHKVMLWEIGEIGVIQCKFSWWLLRK
jgi:hypothetical protein